MNGLGSTGGAFTDDDSAAGRGSAAGFGVGEVARRSDAPPRVVVFGAADLDGVDPDAVDSDAVDFDAADFDDVDFDAADFDGAFLDGAFLDGVALAPAATTFTVLGFEEAGTAGGVVSGPDATSTTSACGASTVTTSEAG